MFGSPYDAKNVALSLPLELHWMGWTTTTQKLQRAGWMLAAQQDSLRNSMSIAFKHSVRGQPIRGIAYLREFEYRYQSMREAIYSNRAAPVRADVKLAHNMLVQVNNPAEYESIDARPTMVNIETLPLDEICHFKRNTSVDTHEIFLEQASLAEVMDIALSKQAPRQAEIREELRKQKKIQEFQRDSVLKAELKLVI